MQPIRKPVGVFVHHNVCIETAVDIRIGPGKKKHLHPAAYPVRRRRKAAVVRARVILRLGSDAVARDSLAGKVYVLKVAGGFGKA